MLINNRIAFCSSCKEYFKIAEFLLESESITRIIKPLNTKVEIVKSEDRIMFKIPPEGLTKSLNGLIIFIVLWYVILTTTIFTSRLEDLLGLTPFILIGLIMIGWVIFRSAFTVTASFNKTDITLRWSFLKIGFNKKRKLNELIEIINDTMYTENYQPIYGISLLFYKSKKIKFGSSLTESERNWLIGEIRHFKNTKVSS